MEFAFNINHLFGDSISVIDNRLLPSSNHRLDDLQANLAKVIDHMGDASAKAQGLNGPITSAHRLRFSDHKLYVVKDGDANNGTGSVVGILKLGRKKLFVLDKHGNQNEMEPLCVLDFYVHELCQRKGYGKIVFQHMLKIENVKAQHLAIDRPSHKFTSFLMKHYNLRATLPQVNNYVIFEGFFTNHPEESYCRNKRRSGSGRPPIAPNSRQVPSPSRPQKGYRNASSGLWSTGSSSPVNQRQDNLRRGSNPEELDALKNVRISPVAGGLNRSSSVGSLASTGSGEGVLGDTGGVESSRARAAHANQYSRYNDVLSTGAAQPRSRSASRSGESPLANSPAARNTSPNVGNVRSGLRSRENTPPFGAVGKHMLNSHVDSYGHGGHLKLTPQATPTTSHFDSPSQNQSQLSRMQRSQSTPSSLNSPSSHTQESNTTAEGNYNLCSPWQPRTINSSWNVLGVPPSGKKDNSPNSRGQHRTTTRFY